MSLNLSAPGMAPDLLFLWLLPGQSNLKLGKIELSEDSLRIVRFSLIWGAENGLWGAENGLWGAENGL
ncbi:MAG: hypothetical protein WBH82_04730, partial [Arcanobacterium sp.]